MPSLSHLPAILALCGLVLACGDGHAEPQKAAAGLSSVVSDLKDPFAHDPKVTPAEATAAPAGGELKDPFAGSQAAGATAGGDLKDPFAAASGGPPSQPPAAPADARAGELKDPFTRAAPAPAAPAAEPSAATSGALKDPFRE